MQKVNWTVIVVVGVIVLVALLIGGSLLSYFRWGMAPGWSNESWGMMGPGMMGGWGFGSFGWLGLMFMWLLPIALLVLTVLGIAWLIRSLGRANTPTSIAAVQTCPNCHRPTQAEWRLCPHCGQALTQSSGTTSPTT